MSKNVLITGGNGQLGSALKSIENNFPNYCLTFTDFDTLDVTNQGDISKFLDKKDFFAIVNCAAYTQVDKAEEDEVLAQRLNGEAPKLLSIEAKKRNIHLIHISTDYVFDGTKNTPISPLDNTTNPKSVYGKTKLEGEENIKLFAQSYIIIRTAWLYSQWGGNFLKTMIRLGKEKDSINVVYDQVGSPSLAEDLAFVIMLCLDRMTISTKEVLHFTNEGVCSWYDFARKIMELKNLNCKVFPILSKEFNAPAPRPSYSVLDKQPLKDFLQLEEIPHWEESLKKCIKNL
ncbi:MAG: dTDP-4-dehydrorhamnose reductase [Bacteroidales bacterium]|jgi:dTDP-4-dehydrorhamnose reductase|nr:dTDP-4-dehydrorhamnose reductase [Bacteroidales bacterium]